MALNKGRAVNVKERPVYDRMTDLMLDGTIHAFYVFEPGEWTIDTAPDRREILTFDEVKALVVTADPDAKPVRTGKAALLDLSKRLLDALVTGNLPEQLVIDARRLIAAA